MKKILLLLLVAFTCAAANAQLVTSTTVSKQKKEARNSGMFLEVGIGKLGGDVEGDGAAMDLGLGYRYGFSEYVAWDILKVKAMAELSHFSESITPQFMTGVRGTSPVLFADMTAFASFSLGYGRAIDMEDGGFAYEIQVGVNVTPRFNVGFVFDSQKLSDWDANMNLCGLRLGVRF